MNERDDRRLIYLVLKKLNLKDKEDEYYDVGLVGLAKGIKTYDKTKGYQRSTYYVKCIKNEICKGLDVKITRQLLQKKGILELDADQKSNKRCPYGIYKNKRMVTLTFNEL